jgi:hypothetical protein
MADEHDSRDSPDDLYPFAQALVRKLLKKNGLKWDCHRVEDAEQELFLAGWRVWWDECDIGLANNRMKCRRSNLLRDYWSEQRHEPKAASAIRRRPFHHRSRDATRPRRHHRRTHLRPIPRRTAGGRRQATLAVR